MIWIERIALSFALSIAVVPLAVFYLNLIGVIPKDIDNLPLCLWYQGKDIRKW